MVCIPCYNRAETHNTTSIWISSALWFCNLAIALIRAVGTALYLRWVRSIQPQRRRLEIQVAERTSELSELPARSNEWYLANVLVHRRKRA
jgi:hypothetical protein